MPGNKISNSPTGAKAMTKNDTTPGSIKIEKTDEYFDLMSRSKEEVFRLYVRTCLGGVHCAKIEELKKSHMSFDIVKVQYSIK
jgi:hypothetical protein